jgi:hypothetical protein
MLRYCLFELWLDTCIRGRQQLKTPACPVFQSMSRFTCLLAFSFFLAVFVGAGSALAEPQRGTIAGVVTTQNGTIPLGGAQVSVLNAADQRVASALTEGDGHFHLDRLTDGKYSLTVALDGFNTSKSTVIIGPGQPADLAIDLTIATVTQSVDVVAPAVVSSGADTIGAAESIGSHETEQLTGAGGLGSALRLLASVIEVPGGVSIKGGRPTQAGAQMGASTMTDPALGLVTLTLPDDAIDSVAVMPNPYAVEYGRFSSGLVVIQTRRGGDAWHARLNNLTPTLHSKRHQDLYNVDGIASFAPTFEVGGPIVKDRLFIEQTGQYRYSSDEVSSRPEYERRTTHWFGSFTRADANLSTKHSLTLTGGFSPSIVKEASLGTFTPPDATVDLHGRGSYVTGTERALWSDTLVSESTVQVRRADVSVEPQGTAPMQLFPEVTLGNFFNTQERSPGTLQLIQTISGSSQGPWGLHLFKGGADVLWNEYDGSSASRTVFIRRTNGTLARRLDFSEPAAQRLRTTDVALFAQDRVQPTPRFYIEYGARLDRDAVVERWNITPRTGAAVLLDEKGNSVLRGGIGLFYERTPSAAGVFEQFDWFTDTRYAADGMTPITPATPFPHTTMPLRTARSRTWDVSYEYRWPAPSLTFRASLLERRGSHELLLDPVLSAPYSQLVLDSRGTSEYRAAEGSVRYSPSADADVTVSYARALAEGDLNNFANFYDTMLWPIIGPNAYGNLPTDVTNRLLVHGRMLPTAKWLLVGVAEWRSGLPYSVVNEYLDFVGPRNVARMPNYFRLDLGVEHRFHILKFDPWIGIRAYNALNSFLPGDVQSNISSPAFGTFYNSQFRQFRIQLRFER